MKFRPPRLLGADGQLPCYGAEYSLACLDTRASALLVVGLLCLLLAGVILLSRTVRLFYSVYTAVRTPATGWRIIPAGQKAS